MSQNFQSLDPNTRLVDVHCFARDLPAVGPGVGPVAGPDEVKWEIRELNAAEEAEFEELTKMFVPFEPDLE